MNRRGEYTMEDFHAEMKRRGISTPIPTRQTPPHGTRARYQKCRCAACRAANSTYYHDLKARKQRRSTPSRNRGMAEDNRATSVADTIIPCGIHPLHFVKVRANGARSGCPMCEMRIEDLCSRVRR